MSGLVCCGPRRGAVDRDGLLLTEPSMLATTPRRLPDDSQAPKRPPNEPPNRPFCIANAVGRTPKKDRNQPPNPAFCIVNATGPRLKRHQNDPQNEPPNQPFCIANAARTNPKRRPNQPPNTAFCIANATGRSLKRRQNNPQNRSFCIVNTNFCTVFASFFGPYRRDSGSMILYRESGRSTILRSFLHRFCDPGNPEL